MKNNHDVYIENNISNMHNLRKLKVLLLLSSIKVISLKFHILIKTNLDLFFCSEISRTLILTVKVVNIGFLFHQKVCGILNWKL